MAIDELGWPVFPRLTSVLLQSQDCKSFPRPEVCFQTSYINYPSHHMLCSSSLEQVNEWWGFGSTWKVRSIHKGTYNDIQWVLYISKAFHTEVGAVLTTLDRKMGQFTCLHDQNFPFQIFLCFCLVHIHDLNNWKWEYSNKSCQFIQLWFRNGYLFFLASNMESLSPHDS